MILSRFCKSFINDCGHDQSEVEFVVKDDTLEDDIVSIGSVSTVEQIAEANNKAIQDLGNNKDSSTITVLSSSINSTTKEPAIEVVTFQSVSSSVELSRVQALHRGIFDSCLLESEEDTFIDNSDDEQEGCGFIKINPKYNKLVSKIEHLSIESLLEIQTLSRNLIENLRSVSEEYDLRLQEVKMRCIGLSLEINNTAEARINKRATLAADIVSVHYDLDILFKQIERAGFEIVRFAKNCMKDKIETIPKDQSRRCKGKMKSIWLEVDALADNWTKQLKIFKDAMRANEDRFADRYGCLPDELPELEADDDNSLLKSATISKNHDNRKCRESVKRSRSDYSTQLEGDEEFVDYTAQTNTKHISGTSVHVGIQKGNKKFNYTYDKLKDAFESAKDATEQKTSDKMEDEIEYQPNRSHVDEVTDDDADDDDQSIDSADLAAYFEKAYEANKQSDARIRDRNNLKEFSRLSRGISFIQPKKKPRITKNFSFSDKGKPASFKVTIDSVTPYDEQLFIMPPRGKEFESIKYNDFSKAKQKLAIKQRRFDAGNLDNEFHSTPDFHGTPFQRNFLYNKVPLPEDHSIPYHGRVTMIDNSTVFQNSVNFHLPFTMRSGLFQVKHSVSTNQGSKLSSLQSEFESMRVVDKLLTFTSFATQRKAVQGNVSQIISDRKDEVRSHRRSIESSQDKTSYPSLSLGKFSCWENIGQYWNDLRENFVTEYANFVNGTPQNTRFTSTKHRMLAGKLDDSSDRTDLIVLYYFNALWTKVNDDDNSLNSKAHQLIDRFIDAIMRDIRQDVLRLQKDLKELAIYEGSWNFENEDTQGNANFEMLWNKEYKRLFDESQGIIQWIHQLLFGKILFIFLERKHVFRGKLDYFKQCLPFILRACERVEQVFCYMPGEPSFHKNKSAPGSSNSFITYLVMQYDQEWNCHKHKHYQFLYFSSLILFFNAKVKWLTILTEELMQDGSIYSTADGNIEKKEIIKLCSLIYNQLTSLNQQCLVWLTKSNLFLFGILYSLVQRLQLSEAENSDPDISIFKLLHHYKLKSLYRKMKSREMLLIEYNLFFQLFLCITISVEDLKKPLLKFIGDENDNFKALLQMSLWENVNVVLAFATHSAKQNASYYSLPLFKSLWPHKQDKDKAQNSSKNNTNHSLFYWLIPHSIIFPEQPRKQNQQYAIKLQEFGMESLWAFLTICTHIILTIGLSNLKLNANNLFIKGTSSSFRVVNNWYILKSVLINQLLPLCSLSPSVLKEIFSGKDMKELKLLSDVVSNTASEKSLQSVEEVEESMKLWLKNLSRLSQFIGVWDQLTDKPTGGFLHILWNITTLCVSSPILPSPSSMISIDTKVTNKFRSIWAWLKELEDTYAQQKQLNDDGYDNEEAASSHTEGFICPIDQHSMFLFSFVAFADCRESFCSANHNLNVIQNSSRISRHQLHTKLLYIISMLFAASNVINPWEAYLSEIFQSGNRESNIIDTDATIITRSGIFNYLRIIFQQTLYHLFSSHSHDDNGLSTINYKRAKTLIPDQLRSVLTMFELNPCLENGLLVGMVYKELMSWFGRESFPLETWTEVFNKVLLWNVTSSTNISEQMNLPSESIEAFERARSCLIMYFSIIVYNPLPIATAVFPIVKDAGTTNAVACSLETIPSIITENEYAQFNTAVNKMIQEDDQSLAPVYEVLQCINTMYYNVTQYNGFAHDCISKSLRELIFTTVLITSSLLPHHSCCNDYPSAAQAVSVKTSLNFSVSTFLCIPLALPRLFEAHRTLLAYLQQIVNATVSPSKTASQSMSVAIVEIYGTMIYLVRMYDTVISSFVSIKLQSMLFLLQNSSAGENAHLMTQYLKDQIILAETHWQHVTSIHIARWKSFLFIQSRKLHDSQQTFTFAYKTLLDELGKIGKRETTANLQTFSAFYSSTMPNSSVPIAGYTREQLFKSLVIQIIHQYASLIAQSITMDEIIYPKSPPELLRALQGDDTAAFSRKCSISYERLIQDFYSVCYQLSLQSSTLNALQSAVQPQNDYGYLGNYYQIIFWQFIFHEIKDIKLLYKLVTLSCQPAVAGAMISKSLIMDELLWSVFGIIWIKSMRANLLQDLDFDHFMINFHSLLVHITNNLTEAASTDPYHNTQVISASKVSAMLLNNWLTSTQEVQGVKTMQTFLFSFFREFMTSCNAQYESKGKEKTLLTFWKNLLNSHIDQVFLHIFK